jgi:hypothetical protein
VRVERLVAPACSGISDHGVDDDLAAILEDPGRIAAEDHRQTVSGKADSSQAPQIVVVEARSADCDADPAFIGRGRVEFPHGQAGERVVRMD